VCAYGRPLNIKDNLSHSILGSSNLTYIELGLNNIGDQLVTALGKELAHHPRTIKYLGLNNNAITDVGFNNLLDDLCFSKTTIQEL
jgi:hypothetical protein